MCIHVNVCLSELNKTDDSDLCTFSLQISACQQQELRLTLCSAVIQRSIWKHVPCEAVLNTRQKCNFAGACAAMRIQ